jgi:ubiquinone/menaquinone biosynthesis C-methylase UbiE
LREAYKKVNKTVGKDLVFRVGDIKRVPYDDNFFDIVYCISVLEHVGSYKETINEIHRIIKPGGIFIVTFDMSLDGISDISIHKARELQKLLVKRFSSHDKEFIGIGDIDKRNKILTTEFIESYDKSLLPWKRPVLILLYSLFKKRNLARILHLTVYCGSYKK